MLVIGHRGASVAAAENTVQAFVLADAMGADGVEMDVRLAPDGRLLVKHDPLSTELSDLAGYPELSDVLAACGDMLVNVEIKNSADEPGHDPSGAVVEPTIAEMRRHGSIDRWIISSFDWETIERCRAAAPDIATAYLVMKATADVIEQTASPATLPCILMRSRSPQKRSRHATPRDWRSTRGPATTRTDSRSWPSGAWTGHAPMCRTSPSPHSGGGSARLRSGGKHQLDRIGYVHELEP